MRPKVGVAPARRAQIVQATIRCLARQGYPGLTMRRVAAEAGVSQGILHYYFRNKRAMLATAAATVMSDLDRRVATKARGARDARGRLRALIRACLDTAVRDRAFWTVFIELWGQGLHDTDLATLNARTYRRARRLIAGGITRGTREGAFRPVDADAAGVVILALLDGLSLQLTFDRELMPVAHAVRLCENALLRYLSREGTGPPRPRTRQKGGHQ